MGTKVYDVFVDEKLYGTCPTLNAAIILSKGIFDEYYLEPNMGVKIVQRIATIKKEEISNEE